MIKEKIKPVETNKMTKNSKYIVYISFSDGLKSAYFENLNYAQTYAYKYKPYNSFCITDINNREIEMYGTISWFYYCRNNILKY